MAYSIDLSGRVAFVTGASSGLGAQFAQTLARAGAAVVLASRRVERLKDLRARIEADGGNAHVVELDVTDHGSIKSAVAHAETQVGSIDILINNSGVSTTQRIQDVTEEDFDFTFDTNVKGAFFVAQEVGKRMLARARGSAPGTYTGGRIVNIADTSATRPWVHRAPHSVSKTGLVMLTRLLSQAYAPHVLTNAISPGSVLVPDGAGPEVEQNLAAETFVGHIGTPGDVVDAMLYLVSAEFVTGQVLVVDGGQSERT